MNPLLWVSALAASLLPLPFLFRFAGKLGLMDEPGGRKGHGKPIPTIGGLSILTAAFAVPHLVENTLPPLLPTLGALVVFVTGLIDDLLKNGLTWKTKLLCLSIGAGLGAIGLYPSGPLLWLPLFLWFLILINAFNFQDNMNGLCMGTSLVTLALLFLFRNGQGWSGTLSLCTALALIPLLTLNFPKARLFLGDQGSLLLGYTVALACAGPIGEGGSMGIHLFFIPFMSLVDMAATLLFRFRLGLPLYKADKNHLSHRLTKKGFTPVQAVTILWLGALLTGFLLPLFALLALK